MNPANWRASLEVEAMCGKFTQLASWREVVAFSQAMGVKVDDEPAVVATPMRFAFVIRLDKGMRRASEMRWGFPDFRTLDLSKPKHMHARCETIDTLPSFADAFARRRGIVLTHTFNEAEDLKNGKWRQRTFTPKSGQPTPIAVIYEEMELNGEVLRFYAMVTTPASPLIARETKQDRMPAVMPPEHWPIWLGEAPASLADVKALLRTYDDTGDWTVSEPPKKSSAADIQPGLFD